MMRAKAGTVLQILYSDHRAGDLAHCDGSFAALDIALGGGTFDQFVEILDFVFRERSGSRAAYA